MKKKLLLISALALTSIFGFASCSEKAEGKTYYISPDGALDGAGTKSSPMEAHIAFEAVTKGDVIKVLPGIYELEERIYLSQSGDKGNYITVENASDTERAIFDFHKLEFLGTNRGITVNGNYWHFNNIEVRGAGDNGMYIGGSHNIVENCQFYENRDTGLQIGRSGGSLVFIKDWPSYNLIKNCTSYNNYDDETFGENADGFAAKLTVGYGNVFDGCIAYRNSDDGWDLFAKVDSGNIGTVVLYNCVAFENGFLMNKTTEAGIERFITRDGDGLGFKLGGSTMKGDVILENCVTFNNRLQGVGDNSNPGVISVNNVTAYNNCASIDDNGNIVANGNNDKESSNFDVARSTASYNNYSNLLSYATNGTCQADSYLGSMQNSVMYSGAGEYSIFKEAVDASTHSGKIGEKYSGMNDGIFASLEAPTGLNNPNIHYTMRNEDGSVQLGDFLNLKDGELKTAGVGADLTKKSYEEYSHYKFIETNEDITDDQERVISVYQSLEVNCNTEAVFQDMLVPSEINGCSINWISSNSNIVSVGEDVVISASNSQEILLSVYRPKEDTKVQLTAEIEYNGVLKTKTFELNVVKDNPSIGDIVIEGATNGVLIIDQYQKFIAPKVTITNGSSYSGKELDSSLYDLSITYKYAISGNDDFNVVDDIYTSKEGVYVVEYEVKSKLDSADVKKASYTVYITSPSTPVDAMDGKINVSVGRDGYLVDAELSNVAGNVYTLASENATESIDNIIKDGIKHEFRSDRIAYSYIHSNSSEYYVHIVITNKSGDYVSECYTTKIAISEIADSKTLLNLLSSTANKSTIYLLTKDLDFTDVEWNAEGTFKGLLNGNGHKISNVTTKNLALFTKLEGTIMNLDFENIAINSGWNGTVNSERVGIVGTLSGGYLHNIHLTNISAKGTARVGGLVGQIDKGHNYLTQISIVNDENHSITGERAGGIVGYIQDADAITEFSVSIENVFVNTNVGQAGNQYVGGVIGRYDNRQAFMELSISKVVFKGHITAKTYAGGIIGGFSNGFSKIVVKNCLSDFTCTYNETPFTVALKNCSPIIGRFANAIEEDLIVVENNFGPVGEYNEFYESTSGRFEANKKNKDVYELTLKFDLKNIWLFDETTFTISLR